MCSEEAQATRAEQEYNKFNAYYRGLFGVIKPVKIIAVEIIADVLFYSYPHFHNVYLVQFMSGKMKRVHEKRIIFEGIN